MKIIEPKVKLWQQGENPVVHVARCARVCYGLANVVKGYHADKALYDSLIKNKHLSMLRHESVYAIIPATPNNTGIVMKYNRCPYIEIKYGTFYGDSIYVATNMNFMLDIDKPLYDLIVANQVLPEQFYETETGHSMMRYTFHIITQISTSRELNRVSPNNIAEKSTRYCLEEGVLCRPYWITQKDVEDFNKYNGNFPIESITNARYYLMSCFSTFANYQSLIKNGMKRQDARGVLPLDTATEVVYTYSVNEWRHIIELRANKRAHPNCQIIANMIKKELKKLGYD